ncbi:MAG: monovalent cation/H+ antiporter complex subunit F [Candidatus Scalindua sp.]|nr:monovalent cation/H+ antiporter complex subunit F [Candidatus Scalindua sp.]
MILQELTLIKGAVLFAFFILIISLFLAFFRLARGPVLPDRIVALDLIVSLAVGLIAGYTILTKQSVFLNTAVVLTMIAFLGTVAFARYLERRWL